jgi:2-hydroxychromene-2-carboxylate isomerase
MTTVRFYFDFLSPYAYLARKGLVDMSGRLGFDVEYMPVDLAALKLAVGNTGPSNRDMPVKLRYLHEDMKRWAAHYDVPFNVVKNHNSRLLNIGTYFASNAAETAHYVEAGFRLGWGEGGALDDEALLARLATEMGWDAGSFLAFVASPDAVERYESGTRQAIDASVFGVPMMLADGQMWWGNDRLMFLESYLVQGTR